MGLAPASSAGGADRNIAVQGAEGERLGNSPTAAKYGLRGWAQWGLGFRAFRLKHPLECFLYQSMHESETNSFGTSSTQDIGWHNREQVMASRFLG